MSVTRTAHTRERKTPRLARRSPPLGDGDAGQPLRRRGLPPPVAPPSLLLFHSPPRPLPPPHSGSPVPTKGDPPCPGAPTVVATFHPLTASSPRLSLDFLPDAADFELYDSHLGLLLLHHHNRPFLVCDPVSRRHARFHPPPLLYGRIVGAALLSREAEADDPGDGGLRFEVVRVAVDDDRPRAWVATHRDGVCSWRALPRSRDVAIEFDPHWP
ncbi:hypothetical protein OsI_30593 [Oryza sativa Indica Group]|uniref:Uncharacterized protein n=1 Tax=Oryza sativa subsp. indica TaxID=39946 RepID=B8BDG5_ORYSI|nr:hypothetical protein OsI_30593 [Oryza sativa Indica Group]